MQSQPQPELSHTSRSAAPTGDDLTQPQPPAAPEPAPEPEPAQIEPRPVDHSTPVSAPVKTGFAQSAPSMENPDQAPAQDELDWSNLAFDLPLEGIGRQLALNSIVHSWQNNELVLGHLPELEVLVKPEIEDQIRQALGDRFGVSLKLELSSLPELPVETPQQAGVRRAEAERQAAITAIRQDPVVQRLHSVFGAELIEDSVRKIGTNGAE